MKITDEPVIVEQTFNNSINEVWNAITKQEEMILWFFENIEAFNPEVGFETQFVVSIEDRTFTHLWKVTEVIPNQKITYGWKYEEYPGDALVTFELIENENDVSLKLSFKVTEDFPTNIPEFSRENCIGGWNYFIGERLKEYLETN